MMLYLFHVDTLAVIFKMISLTEGNSGNNHGAFCGTHNIFTYGVVLGLHGHYEPQVLLEPHFTDNDTED